MLLAVDRQKKILEILQAEKSIRNSELVKILNVSLETIRRDLDILEKEGLVEKVHGGAKFKESEKKEIVYSERVLKNVDEKRKMAKKAIKYIEKGDIIALNSSSTNLEIAKLLIDKEMDVTVITNSILIANIISSSKNINLILAGGVYNKKEFAFLGQITANFLSDFVVNKCFLSVGGVSLEKGITDFYLEEVIVEKKLVEMSQKVYCLADSSKIDNDSLFKIGDIKDIEILITDDKINKKILEKYVENNVKIEIG